MKAPLAHAAGARSVKIDRLNAFTGVIAIWIGVAVPWLIPDKRFEKLGGR